jgi:hypothetical protein
LVAVQSKFSRNCERCRGLRDNNMKKVSPHGEWIIRSICVTNDEFVDVASLKKLIFLCEPSNKRLFASVGADASDTGDEGFWWKRPSLEQAIDREISKIYVLTHERQWQVDPMAIMCKNLSVLIQILISHRGSI